MAATTGMLRLSSGRTVSLHFAANGAVGTYLPADTSQAAASTSPVDFSVAVPERVVDFIAGPATGTIEFISGGAGTGRTLDCAQHQASNSGRPAPNVVLVQKLYRLKVIVVLPA